MPAGLTALLSMAKFVALGLPSYTKLRDLNKRLVPFLNFRTWWIRNTDTGDMIQGQFEPEDLQHNVGSRYSTHYAQGRAHPITQFLGGELETVSFTATVYAEHIIQNGVEVPETLIEWAQKDRVLDRPPILEFWVGDGFIAMPCLLEPVQLTYFHPREFGRSRGAKIRISLRRFDDYKLDEKQNFDTRYHRVSSFDYYEMLAFREYKNPIWGVLLAQDHPKLRTLQLGDTVRLPSAPGLRLRRVEPKSTVFSGLDRRGATPRHELLATCLKRASAARAVDLPD